MFLQKTLWFLFFWIVAFYILKNSFPDYEQELEAFEVEPVGSNDTLLYSNKRGSEDKPWDRHPIQDSLPLDLPMKYPKAYYYELDNATYEEGLRVALNTGDHKDKRKEIEDPSLWLGPYDPAVVDPVWLSIYKTFIASYLPKRLDATPGLCLPAETTERTKIQVVHDRWRRVYIMQKNPNVARMDIEVLLYREAKYQAKHALITIWVETLGNSTNIAVVEARVVGVVPSESVGMFPVVASNPFDLEHPESTYDNDAYNFAPTILVSDTDVMRELNRRRDNMEKQGRANYAIGMATSYY